MKRISALLVVLVLLCGFALSTSLTGAASGDGWEAWWYNAETFELLRVSVPDSAPNSYNVTQYPLGSALKYPTDNSFLGNIAVSGDYERIAYCSGGNVNTPAQTTLVVYDPMAAVIELELNLGVTAGCALSSAGFDDNGDTLVLGVLYDSPYAPQSAGAFWGILMVDISTGQIINQINDSAIANQGFSAVPRPYFYAPGSTVTFYLVPVASGGPIEVIPTYDWFLASNTVQPNLVNNKLNQDTTTGALVWAELDEVFPAVPFQGMGSPLNTIKYRGKDGIERVLENPTDGWVSNVIFMQGAQYIAYNLSDSNYNNLGWFALDQNGNRSRLPIDTNGLVYSSLFSRTIIGSPLGYVYSVEDNGQTTVSSGSFGSPSDTTLWVGNGNWSLIGIEQLTPLGNLTFTGITPPSVSPPVNPPSTSTCPGHLPTRLNLNMSVRITPGPANSLRAGSSLSASRIGEIPGGSTITLLEGPVCADGHTWWRVQYGGVEGWTSEGTGTDYWIEPAVGGQVLGSGTGACPNADLPAFSIGDTFQVDFNDPTANLLLTTSENGGGGDADVRAKMQDNDRGVILDGPVCGASGNRWRWRVRDFRTGIEGWASQGIPGDRWMCSMSNVECGD